VAACDTYILQWEQEIKELQSKILAEIRRKVNIQMKDEAKTALHHFDNTQNLDGEIEVLTTTEAFIDTKIKHAKVAFETLKSTLTL
jgi:hypothetical protein